MNKYLFTDSYDGNIFGYLKTDRTAKEIQEEINNIKKEMSDEDYETYTIEDIIQKLNERGLNVEYVQFDSSETIEA